MAKMIGHEVFILSYNCSMGVFMLRILLEGFSARPAFFPNYFYIEKSGSFHDLIKKEEFSVSAVYDIPSNVPMV